MSMLSGLTALHAALDSEALSGFRAIVGEENVILDPAALNSAATATFATGQSVRAIVRPANRDQVRECVQLANRFRAPLYAISTGKNWGYGSRVPTSDACLLDLGRMNRIVAFDEQLGYVTIEPGVTQQQLYDFLQEKKSRLWMDATGAPPGSSVLGNTIERGFGHTPYGDHFANVCGLEVVLPTGEVIDTGFSRFPAAMAGPLYKWGVGPVFDGLFSQSNLGIVTRMTLWLMPAPEYFQAFFFRCDRDEDLIGIINALRPLRMNGTLRSAMHIANDYKVVTAMAQYPWDEMGGKTPLGRDRMPAYRKKYNIGVWNGSGGLYGTKAQVAEARRLVRAACRGKVSKLQFLDDRTVKLAGRFAKPYTALTGWDLSRALELLKPVYGLMKGIPTSHPLKSCYWRKRTTPPADVDVDRDRCGLLWCSPIAPLDGVHARAISQLTERILLEDGFEPAISLTLLTERTLGCVISISYDRETPGEDEKAMNCFNRLLGELNAKGYYPYRLGVQSMSQMAGDSGYNTLLRKLKQTLDPNGIVSPGRYEPSGFGNG